MSLLRDNVNLVDDLIDKELERFLEGVETSQKGIFNKLLSIVKELELDVNGNVKRTTRNLRLLTNIRKTIQDNLLTDAYVKRVDRLTSQMPAIKSLNDDYFNVLIESFNPNKQLYREVMRNSIEATKNSLLGAGIEEQVINPVVEIVSNSVTDGASYGDMVKELELKLVGSPDNLGELKRYSQQITTDAMNQFNAAYNETLATDLKMEWFYYLGGRTSKTRPFCKKYYNQYFHKKEVEDFGRGKDLDGGTLCTGSFCNGRTKGTNSSNIFRYRGGYNCKHIFKPTLLRAVPKNVIKRAIEKGYYVDKKLQEELKNIKPKEVEKPIVKEGITNYKDATKQTEKFFNQQDKITQESLKRYTVSSGISNKFLRDESFAKKFANNPNGKAIMKVNNDLSGFLNKAPKYQGKTYRGISLNADEAKSFNAQLKKGGIISDKGFMSTSTKKSIAEEFTGGYDSEYLFTVNGKSGVSIESFTQASGENEILFNKETSFMVKNITKKGNRYMVEIDEL